MNRDRLSYRFGPLERHGLLGPLRLGQVLAIGGALVLGVELLDHLGGTAGVAAAVLLLALAVGFATAPLAGRTVEEWAPVALAFSSRSLLRRSALRSHVPATGRTLRTPPALQLPRTLRGVELTTIDHQGRAIGAITERRGRLLTAVLACQALSFALLDPEVQERRLAQWGTVLTTAASAPLRRLQWIERTAPAQGDELAAGCTRPVTRRCPHAEHRWLSPTSS